MINISKADYYNVVTVKKTMRAYRIIKKLMPSSGGGDDYEKAKKSIRLARYGCANRPFFHIVVVLVSI